MDVNNIIDSLYSNLLGRLPDQDGREYYANIIASKGIDEGFNDVITSMSSSQEYYDFIRRKSAYSILGRYGTDGQEASSPLHIISLGNHCLTSSLLKKNHLKYYSLPFDWIFSSPESVAHCIEDDFTFFLDRSLYLSITSMRKSGEPGAEHNYYLSKFNIGEMFPHRDPTGNIDYNYFVRSVERFRSITKLTDRKLFVMISRPNHDIGHHFKDLLAVISKVTSNFFLVCIQLNEPTLIQGLRSARVIRSLNKGVLYEFTPSTREAGVGFESEMDDMSIMELICGHVEHI